jgi:hypothetical protein
MINWTRKLVKTFFSFILSSGEAFLLEDISQKALWRIYTEAVSALKQGCQMVYFPNQKSHFG